MDFGRGSSIYAVLLPLLLALALNTITSNAENVSDDDLVDRIKSNEFVVALFVKKNCPDCDKYETELHKIHDDVKDMFPADVLTVANSQMVRLYNTKKEPSLVFFRHGVPVLYHGPINADEIFHYLERNKVPAVRELTDETFEHLTQASTGSTTGDWFIMFHNRECIDCQRLSAVWEAVGATLRNRVNVARVDKDVLGVKTAKRFNVKKAPEFILIRQGKFYRHEIQINDVNTFVAFAQSTYRNAKTEAIRVPASPFDELVSSVVAHLKSIELNGINNLMNDGAYFVPAITIIGFVLIVILLKCWSRFRKPKVTEQQTSDNSKKSK